MDEEYMESEATSTPYATVRAVNSSAELARYKGAVVNVAKIIESKVALVVAASSSPA